MSDPADTGGSPCSGWPGGATAVRQTDAEEKMTSFILKLSKESVVTC